MSDLLCRGKTKPFSLVLLLGFVVTICQIAQAAFVAPATNRAELNLDVGWKYQLGAVSGTPQAVSFNDAAWQTVSLPHPLKIVTAYLDSSQDCDCTQATFDRTIGWFRKHFTLSGQTGKKVYVEFETVMEVATVYVNGTLVGKHEVSGFDQFFYDITPYVSFTGDNVIAVYVDNNVNNNTPPDWNYNGTCAGYPDGMDYILFGGINGDVFLKYTDSLHIGFNQEAKNAGIVVTTPTLSASSGTVRVVTTIKNEHLTSRTTTVTATVLDANNNVVTTITSNAQAITANSSSTFTLLSSAIPNPNLWSPSSPYLYRVYVAVNDGSTTVNGKYQKFGFRWYSFSSTTGFSLNGQPLKLIGTNRHSAWPFVGGAIPNTVHLREAKQIKAAGYNWVRTCHYPHDPGFLDALDSLGLLATAEPPTWAPGTSANVHTNNATWVANLETAFTNVIRRDINHPSIILWNACINHEGCYAALGTIATTEDPSRLRGQCDVTLSMCYTMNPNEAVATGGGICHEYVGFRDPIARFDNDAQMVTNTQWHIRMVNLSKGTPANSGVADWEMYDNNSFHATGLHGATYPGTFTQANRNIVYQGVADIYRIPKFEYYWYQSELTTTPMVFIANYWTASSPRPVTIYSNCAQVELFLNGTSMGKMNPATGDSVSHLLHPPFYSLPFSYVAGSLVALGYNSSGTVVARDTVRTPGTATQLKVESDADTLLADGADFCRIIVSVCDANGTTVPTATNSISATATGAGSIISPNPIRAEAGKIIFLAQAGTACGTITVTVSSGTLTTATKQLAVSSCTSTEVPPSRHVSEMTVAPTSMTYMFVGNHYAIPPEWSKTMNMIEVYDTQGRLIFRSSINGLKSIDLSNVKKAEGIYVVRAVKGMK